MLDAAILLALLMAAGIATFAVAGVALRRGWRENRVRIVVLCVWGIIVAAHSAVVAGGLHPWFSERWWSRAGMLMALGWIALASWFVMRRGSEALVKSAERALFLAGVIGLSVGLMGLYILLSESEQAAAVEERGWWVAPSMAVIGVGGALAMTWALVGDASGRRRAPSDHARPATQTMNESSSPSVSPIGRT